MSFESDLIPDDEASGDFPTLKGGVCLIDLMELPCAGEEFIEGEYTALVKMDNSWQINARAH